MARHGVCAACGNRRELYGNACLKCLGSGRVQASADAADYRFVPKSHAGHGHVPEHPGRLTYRERQLLPPSVFALPEELPVHGPRHIRDAVARLEEMHNLGHVTAKEYEKAKRRIVKEARHWGIHTEYDKGA
jgi:hypothetical protein